MVSADYRDILDPLQCACSGRLITLNGMKVSEEISEEQSRQACRNVSDIFVCIEP
jgi:hypothetical protein